MTQIEKDFEDSLNGVSKEPQRAAAPIDSTTTINFIFIATLIITPIAAVLLMLFSGYIFFLSYDVVYQMIITFPVTFLTHPVWLFVFIPLSYYHYFRNKPEKSGFMIFKAISLILLIIALPMVTAILFHIIGGFFADILGPLPFDSLYKRAYNLYVGAFGNELGPQLMHYYVGEHFELSGWHEELLYALKIVSCVPMFFSFVFMFNLFYQVVLSKISRVTFKEKIEPGTDLFFVLIITLLSYSVSIPLVEEIGDVPDLFNIIITWSFLLFPILGLRLVFLNADLEKEYRVGRIFTVYYIVFWLLVVAFIMLIKENTHFIMYFLLLIVYFLYRAGLK
ncbi:hypothetical protein [Vibrio genomosp. F10]|uniref:hypothetical protein n=1 Tax=Vibrio genomosp. F10 TaxID=723171 RepID=UPI00114C85F0|nr:hypothetical protein [Vibrio genomosp. F10]